MGHSVLAGAGFDLSKVRISRTYANLNTFQAFVSIATGYVMIRFERHVRRYIESSSTTCMNNFTLIFKNNLILCFQKVWKNHVKLNGGFKTNEQFSMLFLSLLKNQLLRTFFPSKLYQWVFSSFRDSFHTPSKTPQIKTCTFKSSDHLLRFGGNRFRLIFYCLKAKKKKGLLFK